MAYKSGEKPEKGDAILGTLEGRPARGKVLAYVEDTDEVVLQCYGPAVKFGQHHVRGELERHEAPAGDFDLIHRKGA